MMGSGSGEMHFSEREPGMLRYLCLFGGLMAVFLLGAKSTAQDQANLQYHFNKGEKIKYELANKLTAAVNLGGPKQLVLEEYYDMTWEVKDTTKDGKIHVRARVDRFRLKMAHPFRPGGILAFDSKTSKKTPGAPGVPNAGFPAVPNAGFPQNGGNPNPGFPGKGAGAPPKGFPGSQPNLPNAGFPKNAGSQPPAGFQPPQGFKPPQGFNPQQGFPPPGAASGVGNPMQKLDESVSKFADMELDLFIAPNGETKVVIPNIFGEDFGKFGSMPGMYFVSTQGLEALFKEVMLAFPQNMQPGTTWTQKYSIKPFINEYAFTNSVTYEGELERNGKRRDKFSFKPSAEIQEDSTNQFGKRVRVKNGKGAALFDRATGRIVDLEINSMLAWYDGNNQGEALNQIVTLKIQNNGRTPTLTNPLEKGKSGRQKTK
jgi:hypothetical protein